VIDEDFEIPDAQPGDIDDEIEKAAEVDASLISAKGQLAAAQKEMELFIEHRGGFSRRRSYRERELKVEKAEHEITEAKRDVKLRVFDIRSRIEETEAALDAATEQLKIAEKAEDVATVQYDAGLTTIGDVLDASVSKEEAELLKMEAAAGHLVVMALRDSMLGKGVDFVEDKYEETLNEIDELR